MDPILVTIAAVWVLSKMKKQEAQIETPAQTAPIADVIQRIIETPTLATDVIPALPPVEPVNEEDICWINAMPYTYSTQEDLAAEQQKRKDRYDECVRLGKTIKYSY